MDFFVCLLVTVFFVFVLGFGYSGFWFLGLLVLSFWIFGSPDFGCLFGLGCLVFIFFGLAFYFFRNWVFRFLGLKVFGFLCVRVLVFGFWEFAVCNLLSYIYIMHINKKINVYMTQTIPV